MTDWNLIIQGNISLLWIQETLKPENRNKTINELLIDFKNEYEQTEPLNIGTLFMATYLLFLYPRESEIININISKAQISDFYIKTKGNKQSNETENEYFIRRLRNSIAHGNFIIDTDLKIKFEDNNKSKSNLFVAEIHLPKFGKFINEFMLEAKNQHFNK
ncbi:MAG: hypothetical protein K8R54_04235 [Bacteroidales bacterium]|nr:hypothetical protein [Bacteroidales bacterium]